VGELHIAEEAACWERKFMLFKVYLRQSVGCPRDLSLPRVLGRTGVVNDVNSVKSPAFVYTRFIVVLYDLQHAGYGLSKSPALDSAS